VPEKLKLCKAWVFPGIFLKGVLLVFPELSGIPGRFRLSGFVGVAVGLMLPAETQSPVMRKMAVHKVCWLWTVFFVL